ncbi:MAG: DUF3365 domain-containing protein [Chlorobiota bacterium]
MARWGEQSLVAGLVVLLVFSLVLGVIWWQQQAREMSTPQQVRWTPDSLDAVGRAFLRRMQALLLQALQQGPEVAVRICADTAQRFTASFAQQHGISIRRTALRWRNPQNRPDSLEAAWIEQFQRWRSEGRSLDTVVVVYHENDVRLLRPILLQSELCLMCHGSPEQIPSSVAQLLSERYPEDKARGFRVGDVRGALSIRVPKALVSGVP